jgi:flavin-dependent dehydrogenase
MNHSAELDAIILGGGPAGSAAAIELACAGLRVALIERSLMATDKVCGDFLSAETLSNLAALGVDADRLGAVAIELVRFAGPLGVSSAKLPFRARSLTRRALDDALLNRAAEVGALVLRGHAAEGIQRGDSGWQVEVCGPTRGYALWAPRVVLATGKHDLRGLPRPTGPQANLVGLKMYLRVSAEQARELEDAIELVLLAGGYGGLTLVEGRARRTANLCFVLTREAVREVGAGWTGLLKLLMRSRYLRVRLAGAEALLDRPLAISPLPYGMLRREAISSELFAVGDQAAVIPSFTGDGLAIALHSGRMAARELLAGGTAEHFHGELYRQLRRQVSLATRLSRAGVVQPQRTLIELATRVFPGIIGAVAARTRLAHEHHLAAAHEKSCAAA